MQYNSVAGQLVRCANSIVTHQNSIWEEFQVTGHSQYTTRLLAALLSAQATIAQLSPSDGDTVQKYADEVKQALERGNTDPSNNRKLFAFVTQVNKQVIDIITNHIRTVHLTMDTPHPDKTLVYHATSTKSDYSTIQSFLQLGAAVQRRIAEEQAQEGGFYVFRNRERAENHALEFLKDFHAGTPIIITLEVQLNPAEWDLDYELCTAPIAQFLNAHFDVFMQIPDGSINVPGKFNRGPLLVSQCKRTNNGLRLVFQSSPAYPPEGVTLGTYGDSSSALYLAGYLEAIMRYMERLNPNLVQNFKLHLFHDPPLANALKYVGHHQLPVQKIDAFVDGQWIDARVLLAQRRD